MLPLAELDLPSPSARDFDVAVVGAGPAGSSAARELSLAGASVVLLERETLPRYKTCGGGLVSRALQLLPPAFDLPLERACARVEMRFGEHGPSFSVERGEPIVAMVMRAHFDQALAAAALRAGVELRSPCELVALRADAGGVELATTAGLVRARFVVGADGASSPTARLSGWTERVHTIPALEAEVSLADPAFDRLCSAARFDLGIPEGGYGWIFPKRAHLSAGVLTMRRGSFDLRGVLARYLDRAGAGDILSIEHHGYVIPVAPRRGGFARGRVLLAGDAAGLADPLTGEGISYAMSSGRLAARALIDGDFDARRVRSRYHALLRGSLLRELRIARWLAHVLYRRPHLSARLFHRFGQPLCEAVTEVVLGRRSYRELALNPLNYVKLLATKSSGDDRL